ncbi:MAG: hypothetical protein K2H73_00760 [Treponemataceae bacterium]|nr:hypothetical protein [Treponemataceae bacterium]
MSNVFFYRGDVCAYSAAWQKTRRILKNIRRVFKKVRRIFGENTAYFFRKKRGFFSRKAGFFYKKRGIWGGKTPKLDKTDFFENGSPPIPCAADCLIEVTCGFQYNNRRGFFYGRNERTIRLYH